MTLGPGGEIASYDIAQQCHAVFHNVRCILEDAGSAWENLVDITVYLTDMEKDFADIQPDLPRVFPGASALPHHGRGFPAAHPNCHRIEVHRYDLNKEVRSWP